MSIVTRDFINLGILLTYNRVSISTHFIHINRKCVKLSKLSNIAPLLGLRVIFYSFQKSCEQLYSVQKYIPKHLLIFFSVLLTFRIKSEFYSLYFFQCTSSCIVGLPAPPKRPSPTNFFGGVQGYLLRIQRAPAKKIETRPFFSRFSSFRARKNDLVQQQQKKFISRPIFTYSGLF